MAKRREKKDFLLSLNENLAKDLKKEKAFSSFYADLAKEKYKLNDSVDLSKILKIVEEYRDVLNKITSIVFKPQILAVHNEIILRSEQSGALNQESFNKTLKDPQLWKRKNGTMSPEYVHTYETVDTVVTYENKFIVVLLKLIKAELSNIYSNTHIGVANLEELFEIKGINYGEYGLFGDLEDFGYPYENVFLSNDTLEGKINLLILKLYKRVKHIENTEFYRLVEPEAKIKSFVPTNILIHNDLYAYCYKYYRTNFLRKKDDEIFEAPYYNYVVVSLFNYLAQNKIAKSLKSSKSTIKFDKDSGRISFDTLGFKKKMFGFYVSEIKELNALSFETKLLEKSIRISTRVKKTRNAKYLIFPVYSLTSDKLREITEYYEANKHIYNDVIIITMNNLVLEFNHVMNLNYTRDNALYLFKNLIGSFSMLFLASTTIYKNVCPVCGKEGVDSNEECFTCVNCGSTYTLEKVLDKEMIWIKSLRRKY